MKYLHQWSTGKFMPLVVTAHEIATSNEMLLELLEYLRTGKAVQKVHQHVGCSDWLNLYRRPSRMKDVLQDVYGASGGSSGLVWLARQVKQSQFSPAKAKILLEIAPPEFKQQLNQLIIEILKQSYRDNLKDYAEWLKNGHKGLMLTDEMMTLPEMQFFMFVFIPCMLECGKTPSRMFANARRGDRQALLDLVRIDKTVVSHPELKKHLSVPAMQRDEAFSKMYAAAISSGVKYDPDPLRIKAQQAALLILISQELSQKLNPKDVRHLYDAIQKDKTGNPNAIDEDLPEFDGDWRVAIDRAKKKWHIDLARNKTKQLKCNAKWKELPLVSPEDDTGEMPTWAKQIINPPEPDKLGFCERIRRAWKRFKLEVILEAELRRRKKLMANQPADSKQSQSKPKR